MASRQWIQHKVSNAAPTSGRLGDEFFDPGSNKLTKRVAINGTTVIEAQIPIVNSGNLVLDTTTGVATIATRNNAIPLALGTDGNEWIRINTDGTVGISTTSITAGNKLQVNGVISDQAGNLRDLVNNAQGGAYILTAADNGKLINITTGGVTVNINIFSAGNNVTIYNNSAASQTITQGASVTMYLAGTATTGNRTLAQRGIATIVCVAANTFVISGSGLS